MEIIEYSKSYLENVKTLLVELEEFVLTIDKDNLDKIDADYRDKYTKKALKEIKNNCGKCYLAVDNDSVVGLIMGIIPKYNKWDYLDYKCPKRGIITELVVSKNVRGKGIGKALIETMESYFKEQKCEYVLVDVFAYNQNAIDFYTKYNYYTRMLTKIKSLKGEKENK